MKNLKHGMATLAIIFSLMTSALGQDPGWPRRIVKPSGTLIAYQPQVDDWQNHQQITLRMAFSLTPTGGKKVVGVATMQGATWVDNDSHTVYINGAFIKDTYFPSLDSATSAQMAQLLNNFIPDEINISLERVVACLKRPESVPTVDLNNTPPTIFVNYSPAILLQIDGDSVLADMPKTNLKFVVNTGWPIFQDQSNSQYYLLVGQVWLMAGNLPGPWVHTTKIPKDLNKLPDSGRWIDVKKMVPPPAVPYPVIPRVFYSTAPAEVILFDGQPSYIQIPGTQLSYANNTESPVFLYGPTQTYYYLAAGRWFSASSLDGPWTFASLSLPADFSHIPPSSPVGEILSSVPGTPQAQDAVLLAQIPTTMTLNPTAAAAQAKVTYTGDPQFAPIQGTSMQYATNTPDKVIQVGDVYYLCLQGVWFMSPNPQGPWTTANSVPQVIYTIPPSSPVYNVTYVTQTTTSNGNIQASYTAGYLGAFVTGAAIGAIVASGTGYYYPPYIGYPAYGLPVYHPYATPYGATPFYNTRTGAYGVSQTAYGPYGSATRAASYNPYTGTYKQGSSISTPYGRQSFGQAYNPYTGTYAATHQGSSPTAQWGQSVVSRGNQSAYTQHYSTANGSVGSIQGSQGGRGYASSSAFGNTYAGKSSSGDLYAGHDGNVYQKTGSGWQKYNNSTNSWSNVNTQQAQQQAHQDAQNFDQQHPNAQQDRQNFEQQHPDSQANFQQREESSNQQRSSGGWNSQDLDSDRQNRMNGTTQSQRFQQFQHSSGGWDRGGSGWGHGGGFGGGWGGHNFGGFGGGGRRWGGGWGGGGWRR
jgi:hypothetical protein